MSPKFLKPEYDARLRWGERSPNSRSISVLLVANAFAICNPQWGALRPGAILSRNGIQVPRRRIAQKDRADRHFLFWEFRYEVTETKVLPGLDDMGGTQYAVKQTTYLCANNNIPFRLCNYRIIRNYDDGCFARPITEVTRAPFR